MTKISIFKNVKDNIPLEFDLDVWLKQTISPTKELEEAVRAYRETFDDNLKRKLSARVLLFG